MTTEFKLNLGANPFHWDPDKWRDFYFKIAEESCYDEIHVGEMVCAKRFPTFHKQIDEVVERIQSCGKKPILSTLALIISNGEINVNRKLVEKAVKNNITIEANDNSAMHLLNGVEHVIGYLVNTYNESTFDLYAKGGATRICLPPELPRKSIKAISENKKSTAELEVFVFGRLPLAIATRCYHARHYKLPKEDCKLICIKDPDGMSVETVDYEEFLVANGLQTMSFTCANLINEIADLKNIGATSFRISPHSFDMIAIAKQFRMVIDEQISPNEATAKLKEICNIPFSNGFYYGIEGHKLQL